MSALWRWHAIEETEHKAVAYDVYREALGDGPGAYLQRAAGMVLATGLLWSLVFLYHARLVREDGGLTDVRGWGRYLRFLFIRPAVLPKLVLPWLGYFRPSFHPWQHDNFALVRAWKALFSETGQIPV
jgi:predicted metal-dependent hydrolase